MLERLRHRRVCRLLFVFLLLLSRGAPAQPAEGLVLSTLAPLQQLGAALLEGTGIAVENLPAQPRALADQAAFLARQGEQYRERFAQADAVLTLRQLWPGDPLYPHARQANIRIVEIDASHPHSPAGGGIPIAESPVSGERSLRPWLSPPVLLQMLGIVARDLQALFPQAADRIQANLRREQAFYRGALADFETALLAVDDPALFALSDDFVYLTRDLGLFVEDYFVKQDIDWTAEDLAALEARLRASGIRTVLHKWEPAAAIRAAVEAAGAQLVVLDTAETGSAALRDSVTGNLAALLAALAEAP